MEAQDPECGREPEGEDARVLGTALEGGSARPGNSAAGETQARSSSAQARREARWIRAVVRRGSRRAAERLVQAHYEEIYVYARRQCASKEDALDLAQEVFVAALRALPSYDRRRASFRTWLYRIATNKIVDARRRLRARCVPLGNADVPRADDPFARIHDRALLEDIERFVSECDPQVQAVFRLRLHAELTFPEIAEVLDVGEAAAKSQFYRLVARIRKEFDLHG